MSVIRQGTDMTNSRRDRNVVMEKKAPPELVQLILGILQQYGSNIMG
jgi:hypothetical protein